VAPEPNPELAPSSFLLYTQRTWAVDDERPLHSEMGYWPPQPHGGVELVLAHPAGMVEIEVGAVTGRRVELIGTDVSLAPTGRMRAASNAAVNVVGDLLSYDLRMAAVGFRRPITSTRS
jgi:hypothetical protein